MAITEVQAAGTSIAVDGELRRTYTSTFIVTSDTKNESAGAVVNAPGIPTVRTPYAWPPASPTYVDGWAFADHATANLLDPLESRLIWLVTVRHKTPDPEDGQNDRPSNTPRDNPLNEPARWSGNFLLLDKFILEDTSGDLMQTTAEQPFPPYRVEDHRDTLECTINTEYVNLKTRRERIGKLNSSSYWGFQPKVIKLADWSIRIQYYGPSNTPYVVNRLVFQFDTEDKWQAKRPNVGTQEIVNSGSTDPAVRYAPIVDSENQIIQTPLDSSGASDPTQSPIDTQNYHVIKTAAFSDLPVPSTLPNPPFLVT